MAFSELGGKTFIGVSCGSSHQFTIAIANIGRSASRIDNQLPSIRDDGFGGVWFRRRRRKIIVERFRFRSGWRAVRIQSRQRNGLGDLLDYGGSKSFAKIDHQRSIEPPFGREFFQADEELQLRTFLNCGPCFAIDQAQPFFNQQRAEGHARGHNRRAEVGA